MSLLLAEMVSRAGFGLWTVVWIPLIHTHTAKLSTDTATRALPAVC